MHLLNTKTLQLEEHIDNIPPYVILSHTWGDQEVSYQEMATTSAPNRPQETQQKAGYAKILETCHIAKQVPVHPDDPHSAMISHVWIDTCCIDKSSSAALTENINSMYEFYTRARLCVVHLVDLPSDVPFEQGIKSCRWITRGWTLQETIASREIHFYSSNTPDKQWQYLGTKSQLSEALEEATNVPRDVLTGTRSVASYSVAQRMSWASKRNTTRPEDVAYCLLGIFGVNMPLIYGERDRAFRRLQEHIIQGSNDMTIFAWDPATNTSPNGTTKDGRPQDDQALNDGRDWGFCGILAPSPANFQDSNMITPWSKFGYDPEYTVTNKGLRMEVDILYVPWEDKRTTRDSNGNNHHLRRDYVIALGEDKSDKTGTTYAVIHIRKLGPDLYIREQRPMRLLRSEFIRRRLFYTRDSPFYVIVDENALDSEETGYSEMVGPGGALDMNNAVSKVLAHFRQRGIRFLGPVLLYNVTTPRHWDSVDQCFFSTPEILVNGLVVIMKLTSSKISPAGERVLGNNSGGETSTIFVTLGVLMIWDLGPPSGYDIRLFDTARYEKQTREIFSFRQRQGHRPGLKWRDFEWQYSEMAELGNQVRVEQTLRGTEPEAEVERRVFVITASSVLENVHGFHGARHAVDMFRVVLRVQEETTCGTVIGEMDGMDLLVGDPTGI